MMKPTLRRSRGPVLESASFPSTDTPHPERAPLAAALGQCTEPQRTMLALRLVERLSAAEAAATLGVSVQQFERAYRTLLSNLRRSVGRTQRAAARRDTVELARLEKAS